jgi:hypothetical protein
MANIIKKFADWIPPSRIRRLSPPGVEEKQMGRPMMKYPEFRKKWKFREVPDFPIREEQIKDYYEQYKEFYKPSRKRYIV